MYSVLVILAVIAAILLILIVLVQESKGGGLTSNMAGGNSIMGVHKTTNFVENATWTLAALLVVLSIVTHFCTHETKSVDTVVTEMNVPAPVATPEATAPALNLETPAAPATPAETPAPEAAN